MAEFILKALVKARGMENEYYIESAAVSAEELGNGIYPPAKRCLSQHGVAFDSAKRARQVRSEDYARFDRIICMDAMNLRWIKRIIPQDPDGKIHLMMSYTGRSRDVADPWYTGDFETTSSLPAKLCLTAREALYNTNSSRPCSSTAYSMPLLI